jgi:crotonobetainyl-CoA:carnitine CoA-transferase CaiB-like acyl-CoA transferase
LRPTARFTCADDREIVISVQNEREWAALCDKLMGDAALARDERFSDNPAALREPSGARRHASEQYVTERVTPHKTITIATDSRPDLLCGSAFAGEA